MGLGGDGGRGQLVPSPARGGGARLDRRWPSRRAQRPLSEVALLLWSSRYRRCPGLAGRAGGKRDPSSCTCRRNASASEVLLPVGQREQEQDCPQSYEYPSGEGGDGADE